MYYHDEAAEQIDLNSVLNATESICSALGFKLGKSWEAYANELLKMPWTSIYLASLELDVFKLADNLQSRIFKAVSTVQMDSNGRISGIKKKQQNAQREL